jgi:toxin FitB
MYLLDTCVLFEARRGTAVAQRWIRSADSDQLYLSVITISQIQKGIEIRRRTDRIAASSLQRWLDGLQAIYSDRVLPVDMAVALAWGRLKADRVYPVADALIAATALVHRKVVVTRDVAAFEGSGVEVLNPWA